MKLNAFSSIALSGLITTGLFAAEKSAPKEAPKAESFSEAFTKGTFTTKFRLAYEHSDLENNGKDKSNGLSLRIRPSFRTAEFNGISAFIEGHANLNLVEDFNSGRSSGSSSNDVIADPEGARIHQAYLDLTMIDKTLIRLGRQEIILDDARFVGNVDWRQNGQSFDAVTIVNSSIDKLTLTGSYIAGIQDIKLHDTELEHLAVLHAKYKACKEFNLSTFAYFLDMKSGTRDNVTLGLHANGKVNLVNYKLTFADQEDYQEGTGHNGQMYSAFLGLDTKPVNFGMGYEYLTGADDSNDKGFDTLVGTAHKFNGWSDQFLGTNGGGMTNGLEDIYFQVGTEISKTKLLAVYHIFDTTENNGGYDAEYGEEVDLLVKRKFKINEKHEVTAIAKAAFYNAKNSAGNPTKDETVYWLRMLYQF